MSSRRRPLALAFAAVAALAAPALADTVGMVADLWPGAGGGIYEFHAVELGGRLVFAARDGAVSPNPVYLWEYDGVAPPALVPGQTGGGIQPQHFALWHGELHYSTNSGGGIWRYDGAGAPLQALPGYGSPTGVAAFVTDGIDLLVFTGTSYATGIEPFAWSGAGAATAYEVAPGPTSSFPDDLRVFGDQLYFAATDAAGDRELWRFDGSSAVERVADLRASGSSAPHDLVVLGTTLYFVAFDEAGVARLWRLPDTAANPELVSPTLRLDGASDLGLFRGAVLMRAYDEAAGPPFAIWRFDGAAFGPLPAGDLPDHSFSRPAEHAGALYWIAGCGCSGTDLLRYSGGGAPRLATQEFQDLSLVHDGLLAALGRLFFVAAGGDAGTELWELRSDNLFGDGFESGDTGWWSAGVP